MDRKQAVAACLAGRGFREVAEQTLNPDTGRPYSARTVSRWVGMGKRKPGPIPATPTAEIVALVGEGRTFREVGELYGLSAQAVHERYLRAAERGEVPTTS